MRHQKRNICLDEILYTKYQYSMCNIIFSLTFLAQYNIQRTCTSEIKINMFMVDHVCMSESNRRGKLCFCEDVSCNDASKNEPGMDLFTRLLRYTSFYIILSSLFGGTTRSNIGDGFNLVYVMLLTILEMVPSMNLMTMKYA